MSFVTASASISAKYSRERESLKYLLMIAHRLAKCDRHINPLGAMKYLVSLYTQEGIT
jgi:hypothetical protein